jgi:hypothetical protein
VFDIAFLPGEPPYDSPNGWTGLWGETALGEFREGFCAPVGAWGRADYERQWVDGARRLIGGARESAFVVEAGRLWWTAWRDGEDVVVQQRLLVDEAMAPAWTARAGELPYELVGPRETHAEDGQPFSEWRVRLADMEAFVARRAGAAAAAG